MNDLELLAPAGSWEALRAAVQAGANAVYLGLPSLNMRSLSASPFSFEELPKAVAWASSHDVKIYVTLNSILYDQDMPCMKQSCDAIRNSGAAAVIASDIAAIQYARSIGLPVHISTQCNVSNLESVKFFAAFSDVVVLARELRIEQIRAIYDGIQRDHVRGPSGSKVRIELFVHGALCVALAGKCHMSLALENSSANRGECRQICRRRYRVLDDETGKELALENQYVMSPKDLCTVRFLKTLVQAGARVLKIEGRGRSPEYVFTVTSVYREALDAIRENTFDRLDFEALEARLKTVYNRGFWEGGYYLGHPLGEWAHTQGSVATTKKILLGAVVNYFAKSHIAECRLFQSNSKENRLRTGDHILIMGPTTGIAHNQIISLKEDEFPLVTFPFDTLVRRNDKLYKVVDVMCERLFP